MIFERAAVLAIATFFCAVAGCALDPVRAHRADSTVAAAQDRHRDCPVERTDACAAESPYRELLRQSREQSTPQHPLHFVNLLDEGEAALLLRVHLIRSAQTSIALQTFIFSEDDVGYLILDELVKAARRGVRVQVIVDQLFSLADSHLYAQLARAHVNFEMRVYNPTFHKANTPPLEFAAGILCCFLRFNQRMHDKLILVDDAIGIAGGRNYEDRYFDWDDTFDYRDRDVLVAGPVGASMRATFDKFWRDPHTVPLAHLRDVAADILRGGIDAQPYATHAYANGARVADLSRRADDAGYIAAHFTSVAQRVGRIDYFSDAPGKPTENSNSRRNSMRSIEALLRDVKHEVVLQTPYLVLSSSARKIFHDLHETNPALRMIVSTNSLAATDAFYVYAISYKYKKRYLKLGFEIHEFKPIPAEAAQLVANYVDLRAPQVAAHPALRVGVPRARYSSAPLKQHSTVRLGLHAKSMVIDGDITIIGSHNFDPRSELHNTEAGFIIFDRPFAQAVRTSILRDADPANSWTIARRPTLPFFGRINTAIANFSAALPIFDFWPFRYASSFELKPGCQALPPGAPGFYGCYTDVGDFPQVDLPLKSIYTRIVTAFGAGLASIM